MLLVCPAPVEEEGAAIGAWADAELEAGSGLGPAEQQAGVGLGVDGQAGDGLGAGVETWAGAEPASGAVKNPSKRWFIKSI
jgi:hypothetical protein